MARTKTQGVEREPSGRISRKADVQQMSYSQIERMKRSIHLCAADPRHGSIVGLLNLSGQISDGQFRAANTIHALRQAYVAVYGVPASTPKGGQSSFCVGRYRARHVKHRRQSNQLCQFWQSHNSELPL